MLWRSDPCTLFLYFLSDAELPLYCPLPAAAELPPPPPAAATQLPPAASSRNSSCSTAPRCCQQKQQEHRYLHQPHHQHKYWHQCPHHHFACCHPGRCHHHPHGSHGLNQAAEVRDEAGGEEEDKAGEPYSTLKTHILIISIIKIFNLPPFENSNEFVTTYKDALL